MQMRIRLAVAAVIIAFGVPLVALTGSASAAGGPAVCTISGSTSSAKGLSLTSQTISVSFAGSATCVGGGGSGGVFGSGTLTGTCASAKATFNVGGALNGTVGVTTLGPIVLLTGTLNGSSATAAGVFIPTTGNCVTTSVTHASFLLAGVLA
jgi:hypothetical protein